MSPTFAMLLVKQFEADKIRWGEDERYLNLAAYYEAKLIVLKAGWPHVNLTIQKSQELAHNHHNSQTIAALQ